MKYWNKQKKDESEDVNFICGYEVKEGEAMFMAIEELESLVDDACCKYDVYDDLVKGNKKVCVPVDDNLHRKVKKIDDE